MIIYSHIQHWEQHIHLNIYGWKRMRPILFSWKYHILCCIIFCAHPSVCMCPVLPCSLPPPQLKQTSHCSRHSAISIASFQHKPVAFKTYLYAPVDHMFHLRAILPLNWPAPTFKIPPGWGRPWESHWQYFETIPPLLIWDKSICNLLEKNS